jgi:hypothetical protein
MRFLHRWSMPAFRILGHCCLALLLVFALALVSADQARLGEMLSAACQAVSQRLERVMVAPMLGIAFAVDAELFDPPPHGSR